MSFDIPHILSFCLTGTNTPAFQSYLADYVQLEDQCVTIRGDVSGAPTDKILDLLIDTEVKLAQPHWHLSIESKTADPVAYELITSVSGDQRWIQLMNPPENFIHPNERKLKPDCDAILSKKPSGLFSLVDNNLVVSPTTAQRIKFASTSGVKLKNESLDWLFVQPHTCKLLDTISFTFDSDRNYRAATCLISKEGAKDDFDLSVDHEKYGMNLANHIYILSRQCAKEIFQSKKQIGDIAIEPIHAFDSPEGHLARSIHERMNVLRQQEKK